MTVEEMKRLKRERGFTNEQISEWSGIPVSTVRKVFSGETKNPRFETLQALEKFFAEYGAGISSGPVYDYPPKGEPVLVKEGNIVDHFQVKEQGDFTAEDYRDRREHERIELIDGVIFNLASPTSRHQQMVGEIFFALSSFIKTNQGDCIVYLAPVSVYLDRDEKTVVEPDVMVICDRDLLQGDRIWGPPELVVEVLSPSTRMRDLTVKQAKYAAAGVREYWIIDMKKRRVIVYDYAHDFMIHLYSFRDKVPVGIWDGQCEIDFAQIDDLMRSVYGESEEE